MDKRTVLRFDPRPRRSRPRCLPLSRNEALSPKARDPPAQLRKRWNVDFDDAGRSAAATAGRTRSALCSASPWTSDTLEDEAVTVRERDTMAQERIGIDAVESWLAQRLPAC